MVLVSIHLQAPPHRREEILETIRGFIGPTSVEPGCQGIRCLQDASDEESIVLEEKWDSQGHLEKHIESSDYRAFLALLETAVEKPVVEFHNVSKTSGMEVIEEVINRIENS